MIYTSRIQKATNLAIKTHELDQKQKRKGKDVPYITHPLSVGLIFATAGATEDVVVAGILHDTIEDSVVEHKVTKEMIAEQFGENVAELVLSVTEQNKSLSWEERKAEALEHIKTFSNDSLLLKSADIISNTSELIADYKIDGEKTFERFNAPKERILKGYNNSINAILEKLTESPLIYDLRKIISELERISNIQMDIPFIAFTMKDEDGTFEVNLVNPTDTKYERVHFFSGAFCGDEDGLLETSKVVREKGVLLPKSSIKLDSSDWGELDFVIWYHLDLYVENSKVPTMVWFQLEKGGGNYDEEAQFLPVVEKVGVYIKLDDRGDGEKIEQIVKHTDMEGKYTESA